jgi:3-oxoacyl-[acyl-carrier-protein] synthase II
MAIRDAGLEPELVDPKRKLRVVRGLDADRFAAVIGTGIGGIATIEESHGTWTRGRSRKGTKRYWLPMLIPNAVAAQVAIRFQARAECKAVVTACAAGTMAIGDAWRLIRDGEADAALTGGTEALLEGPDGYGLMGFDLLRVMSKRNGEPERASRPFDRDRDGFILSEGAGILFLEERERALARGARIYAEMAGYATNCDAYHIVMLEPEARQIVRLMEGLLRSTGTRPEDVDYINAHGTSTVANDRAETAAIRRVFGRHADDLLVSATKSMTGHGIAASGGIEAAATALAVHHGVVPPTINLDNPDPECDLNCCPWKPVRRDVRVALSNSYGFGGHNASILLRRHEG